MPAQAPIDIFIRPLMLKVGWSRCEREIGEDKEYYGELVVAEMNGVKCETTVAGPCFLRARLLEENEDALDDGGVDRYTPGYVTREAQDAATRPLDMDRFGYTFSLPGKCTMPPFQAGLQLSLTLKQQDEVIKEPLRGQSIMFSWSSSEIRGPDYSLRQYLHHLSGFCFAKTRTLSSSLVPLSVSTPPVRTRIAAFTFA